MKLPPTIPSPSETPQLISRSKSDLADLLGRLPVLYRVFDEDSPTALTEDGFIANAFLSCSENLNGILEKHPTDYHFNKICEHVRNWCKGVDSPWISVSPLWLWAIVECVRRFRAGKRGVGLALIDPTQLSISGDTRKVFYAIERDEIRDDRTARLWSNDPQEILVFGAIPRKAIISQVPLADIIPNLPPFFFKFPGLRVIQNIAWTDVQTWNRFLYAHRQLLSSLCKRRWFNTPESHGKAAYNLAHALVEPKWKEVTDAILKEEQEAAREKIDYDREMEALAQKMSAVGIDTTGSESDDSDMEVVSPSRLRYM